MQTASTAATAVTVAAHLPAYAGPLGRFLQKQAEVKAAAEAVTPQQLAALSSTVIQYGPLASKLKAETAATETLRAMQRNIMALVADPSVFSDAERLRCNDSVYQCECLAQLQRWFRNVHRVGQERESSLRLAFADGSYCHIPVATA